MHPAANCVLLATAGAAGLLLGSFLNVVVHRGPAMWGLADSDRKARGDFVRPRSYCPSCNAAIAIPDLVPIVGFVRLRGRCRSCAARIPLRYPLVEAAGAAAALASLLLFGATWAAFLAAAYFMTLIALAAIDHETGYLPDALTFPLIAGGVAANSAGAFTSLPSSLIGAAAGYLAFRAIAEFYLRVRGREGLGGGDAKLLAAIGAWAGWQALAPAVFVASLTALLFVAAMRIAGRTFDAAAPIRFGPALCAAGALSLALRSML